MFIMFVCDVMWRGTFKLTYFFHQKFSKYLLHATFVLYHLFQLTNKFTNCQDKIYN